MKNAIITPESRTDWERIGNRAPEEIDTSEIPALDADFFERAHVREPAPQVSFEVEPDVIAWFRAQGAEAENKMRAALRIYVAAHQE